MIINNYLDIIIWSSITIFFYFLARKLYSKHFKFYFMPLALAPILISITLYMAMSFYNITYSNYSAGTKWLIFLLGPAVISFAVPIYEQRALIKKYWAIFFVAMLFGGLTSIISTWALAVFLNIPADIKNALLPRTISTPFAMEMAGQIGSPRDMTALFVVTTGVFGAICGQALILFFEKISGFKNDNEIVKSVITGAVFGVGAHAAGTSRAYEIGAQEGAIAGMIMVLIGLGHILLTPLVLSLLSSFS